MKQYNEKQQNVSKFYRPTPPTLKFDTLLDLLLSPLRLHSINRTKKIFS